MSRGLFWYVDEGEDRTDRILMHFIIWLGIYIPILLLVALFVGIGLILVGVIPAALGSGGSGFGSGGFPHGVIIIGGHPYFH